MLGGGSVVGSRIAVRTTERIIMAKKAELLEKAAELKLAVSEKNTIAEIEAAIAEAADTTKSHDNKDKDVVAEREAVVAKSGKRSQKALDEAAEKAEKEARKEAGDTTPQSDDTEAHIKKGPKPVTRPRLERRGKKYQEVAKNIEKNKLYSLDEALKLATETSPVKFDASVEVHIRLGVDPRQADQNIRSTVALPHGTGKDVRVAVFAPESEHAAAKKAGADIIGDEEFLSQLDKEELNVSEAKAGKVEYRVDKQAIVHLSIGKVSFGTEKLSENARAFLSSLNSQKPSSLKGVYIKSVAVATTMGPGIKVENSL